MAQHYKCIVSLLKHFLMIINVREIVALLLQKGDGYFSDIISHWKAFQQTCHTFYGAVPYCIHFMLIPM